MAKRYCVTTPIYCVNAVPHVVQALTTLVRLHCCGVKEVEMMRCGMRLFVTAVPGGVVGKDFGSTATS